MAIDNYSHLSTAISTWARRTFTGAQTDEFIAITEAYLNRRLGSNYRRKVTATITTDATGLATIPSGVISIISLTRNVLGSQPLKQVSWDALVERNPYQLNDDPSVFAIKGTSLQVAQIKADDFIAVYWAKLTGLSAGNTTNWLLDFAPDVYLFMCRSVQCAFNEDEQRAATYKGLADQILDDLIDQANVAEYGNAEMTLDMVTP